MMPLTIATSNSGNHTDDNYQTGNSQPLDIRPMTMIEEAEIAAQHDSPTPHHAAGGLMGEETYRGWSIGPAYVGWSATGPNFDASWEGEEDGWVSNGECSWGWTREECIAGIDEWFEEHCNA